jgi:3-oxoacyl-[acyl-carrier protein] reductase
LIPLNEGGDSAQKTWAWVLGGSAGLGRAIVEEFLGHEMRVTISSRPGPRLSQAVADFSHLGTVDAISLDLSMGGAVTQAIESLLSRDASIPDVVVFNGGGPAPGTVIELGVDGLDRAYQLLLRSAYELLAGLAPAMTKRASGVIVFVTSSAVFEPMPHLAASTVMRTAVTALANMAARELAPHGVRVLCVAPGRIATDRVAELDHETAQRTGTTVDEVRASSEASIPIRRYGTPAEFASVVQFLSSPVASYMTGTTVLVDGGKTGGLLS